MSYHSSWMAEIARYIPWSGLALALLVLLLWRRRRNANEPRRPAIPPGADTFADVQSLFMAPPAVLGRSPRRTVSVVGAASFELMGNGVTQLVVAFPDGAVSLYLEGSLSVHGLGGLSVREAADAFRASVATHRDQLRADAETRLVDSFTCVIRFRTEDGCRAVRRQMNEPQPEACAEMLERAVALQKAVVSRLG